MRRLLSEPLIQFLMLGALIFLADSVISDRYETGDNTIRVTQQHVDALRTSFQAEKGRQPGEAELQVRLQQWLDEQILYLEAKALGLDQRDSIVRRQMVQKMRFLLADAVPVPDPSDAELQAFLDQNAERYGHSPKLSFEQVFLSRGKQGNAMGESVRKTLDQLASDPDQFMNLGDSFHAGQVISALNESQLRREFGKGFYQRIIELPDNEWQGPIASNMGLHMIRITGRSNYRTATLSEVRKRVENDWRVHQREVANTKAMKKLRDRFQIEYEITETMGAG